ncbi:hypothetical protein BH20ACT2_BH20ACT2_02090 [soil metagenome]
MSLVDTVLEVHDLLEAVGTPHAFGGALALAYLVEPRGTVDIDVNVFASLAELDAVLETFSTIGLRPERGREDWVPVAGIRLRREADPVPVDAFPSLDERYAEIERRCTIQPFGPGPRPLPFLSAEDLVLFKLSFGRDKDWVDVRRIAVVAPLLDIDYIEDQLVALRGATMYPRLARLRAFRREHNG